MHRYYLRTRILLLFPNKQINVPIICTYLIYYILLLYSKVILLKPSSRNIMVYTYVTNGIPIDFDYIRKELIRLDKFKEYQSWLDKTYLGIYQNRAYLLLFITFMIRKIFARRGVDRFDLVNIHNEKLRLVFGGNHRLIKNNNYDTHSGRSYS